MKHEQELRTLAQLISIIGTMCTAPPDKILSLIEDFLFTEDESSGIHDLIDRFEEII